VVATVRVRRSGTAATTSADRPPWNVVATVRVRRSGTAATTSADRPPQTAVATARVRRPQIMTTAKDLPLSPHWTVKALPPMTVLHLPKAANFPYRP